MSRLAPGRTHDMRMLLERRDRAAKYTAEYDRVQRKIDDLIDEGKDPVMHSLRHRLVGAARAADHEEILKISKQIDKHVYKTNRAKRWLKKG